MAMVENVDLKGTSMMHACKICKKGFSCGGALGEHMSGHSLGDVNGYMGNDPMISNVHDKPGGGNKKRTYFLRTTANRFVGNKLLTLNSFNVDQDGALEKECHWVEGKRLRGSTKMENVYDKENGSSSNEEEDLANCLVMLSNGKLDPMSTNAIKNSFALGPGKDDDDEEEEDKAAKEVVNKGMFQCKACKKVFSSHQALGGHRASHKKVKGCFAARFDHNQLEDDRIDHQEDVITGVKSGSSPQFDLNQTLHDATLIDHHHHTYSIRKKTKVHECSICHRVFSSGQALGGHKRCHWLSTSHLPDTYSIPNLHDQFQYHDSQQPMFKRSEPLDLNLDLNLPALVNDTPEADLNNDNPLKFEVWTRNFLPPRANEGTGDSRNRHQNTTTNMLVSLHGKRKLSEMNLDGGSSTWLQMGITSSTSNGGGAFP